MIIRKEFRVESAHIVRNCSSERCKSSVHGHSAVIEVFLESRHLDNADMVYDFGLMKGTIKQFIDSMDHCYLLCDKDKPEFQKFIKENCSRWISLPFNPSAECLSLYIFKGVQDILEKTITNNGEGVVSVAAVRYHETTTGYAECDVMDLHKIWNPKWGNQIKYSEGVTNDWSEDLKSIIFDGKKVENPVVKQQIKLK